MCLDRRELGQFSVSVFQCVLLVLVECGETRLEHLGILFDLLDDRQQTAANLVRDADGVTVECLGYNGNDAWQIGVVGAQHDRMVGLDQFAQIAVDMGRFFFIFDHRQPREPERQKKKKTTRNERLAGYMYIETENAY